MKRDLEQVEKAKKLSAKDKEAIDKKMWSIIEKFEANWKEFDKVVGDQAPKLLKESRAVYTASDKELKKLQKNKKENAEAISTLLAVRKAAYNLGVALKTIA